MKSLKELKRILKQGTEGMPEVKVALLGDTATQLLATALKGEGAARGLAIDLYEAEYSQVEMQVLDPGSDFHAFGAQFSVIFQSTHKLLEAFSLMEPERRASLADERLAFVRTLCECTNGKIIYFTYPEIGDAVFGSYQTKVQSSFIYQTRKLNLGLMELCQEYPQLFLCDLAELQAKYGRDVFFQSNVYVSTEMILSVDALPLVASRVLDIICANRGQFKKCLILDLDNTVWGGVVGDDGWENLQLGHGLGIGKAFTEFQQWVLKLRQRGIIICVCSKNDEAVAKEAFEKNPEMVLKLDDIAVFVANWENKADNIRKIQSILNIGFDSMVFLDDNPFERGIVRDSLPDVCVPELPEDPGEYLECLYALNLFETASYSEADKDRTKQYQAESNRVSYAGKFTNESDYLKSLGMESAVRGFEPFNIPRVAQLSQRSNQFNLRTVRYTEDQVKQMATDPGYGCLTFTLEDKFGDNGLVCVIILRKQDAKTLFIDTWLMSCRVLKRGMEHFTMNTIVDYASANGFERIVGEYLPTPKNGMVAEHYPGLGFTKLDGAETAQYELNVSSYEEKICHIAKK